MATGIVACPSCGGPMFVRIAPRRLQPVGGAFTVEMSLDPCEACGYGGKP